MGTTRDGTALVVPITLFLALDAGMKLAGAQQCSEAAHPVSAADGARSGKRSSVDRPNSFAGASKSGHLWRDACVLLFSSGVGTASIVPGPSRPE